MQWYFRSRIRYEVTVDSSYLKLSNCSRQASMSSCTILWVDTPHFFRNCSSPFGSSIAIHHQLLVTTWKCPRTHYRLLPARFDVHSGSHKCIICKRIMPAGLVKDPAQVVLVSVKAESDCNFAQGLFWSVFLIPWILEHCNGCCFSHICQKQLTCPVSFIVLPKNKGFSSCSWKGRIHL